MEGNKPKKPVTIGVIGNLNCGRKSLIDAITKALKEKAVLSNEKLEDDIEKNSAQHDIFIDISNMER